MLMVLWFRLESIFDPAQGASKKDTCFKSGQKKLNNNNLASLVYKFKTHSVAVRH